jgi:cytochrome c553
LLQSALTMPLLRPCPAALLTALLLAVGSALAAAPATSLSPLALSCLACHEPTVDASTMPSLARFSAAAIAASLRAARDDPQLGSIMARYAQFLSDAEIEALAAELGRVEPASVDR